jgi:choline-sulfatase
MRNSGFFARYVGAVSTVLLLAAAGCGGAGVGRPAPARPDIIVVTIDTLRADRILRGAGPAGPAPAVDAVGREGAAFLDATAHAPLTLPSHASIFTGRYPPVHGVRDNAGFTLDPALPTLASTLRGAGYRTAAFVSSFVLRASTGLSQGFDLYDDRFAGLGSSRLTTSRLERRGPEVAREAARWLATAPRPYFLWVHFYDPHAPYDPPPAFASKFPAQPYDGEVAASDFGVATLLDALPADRRAATLVVITADHGESLGEHGESEHGILLYDATLHVPLVMRGPGIPAGMVVRRQVRHVDLLPTITDLAGVKPPSPLDGVSLVPLLSGRAQAGGGLRSDPAAADSGEVPLSYAESRFGELHFGWSAIHSVRDGAFKYIDGPAPELYEIDRDPGERRNQHAERAATSAALARAVGTLSASGRGLTQSRPAAAADAAERLRSLGYVSGRVELAAPGAARPADAPGGEDPKQEIARYERYVAAFNRGLSQLESGHAAAAEAIFRDLARAFPRAFEAHQYLARALAARGAFPQALAEFDRAISLGPREPAVRFDEARALADAGQFDRAFARIAEGRALEPASFYGALTEGLVAAAAGQPRRAETAYRDALALNPALSIAHFELGRLAEGRGDRDAARSEYRRALDGDASMAEAARALDRVANGSR